MIILSAVATGGALRNFTKFAGKHLCQRLFFNKDSFIKKESLTQMFSSEFCEISKNTFFTEDLRTTAFILYDFTCLCFK